MSDHCDDVASATADSAPARAPASRRTSRYTDQIATIDKRMSGRRVAHSTVQEVVSSSAAGCDPSRPNTRMPMAMSQKVRTGLDQNSGLSSGEPGHHWLT